MKKLLGAIALATTALVGTAHAADAPYLPMKMWFVKLGAIYVVPESGGGAGVLPANVTAGNAATVTIEAGRFITNNISVSVTGGAPPTHEIYLGGADTGSSVTLGAFALDAQFHLINNDKFDAYVGAGIAYNIYFSDTSPVITSIDNGFAPVLQAGVEYKATDTFGIFADVKKEFYSATTHTVAGTFSEKLDPWVFTAGVAFHF